MNITIQHGNDFSITINGSIELCSIVTSTVFDFTGVADRPPKQLEKTVADIIPVADIPVALKNTLDESPRAKHYWTAKKEDILRDNFFSIGVQGIIDKVLLPGFTFEEIKKHCDELDLKER